MSDAVLAPESDRPTEGGVALAHFPASDRTELAAEVNARPTGVERHVKAHLVPTWTVEELLSLKAAGPTSLSTTALAASWSDPAERLDRVLVPLLAHVTPVRERVSFFAMVDVLRGTFSLPLEQVVQLAGAQRRTYYNWKSRGHAPDLAGRKLARAGEWLDRLSRLAPQVEFRVEANPTETGTLGGLLAAGATDAALAAHLADLVSPPPARPIHAEVVGTAVPEREHDPDELLAPDEILAMAAAAPIAPRRRRAGTIEGWTPRELTDSVADGS